MSGGSAAGRQRTIIVIVGVVVVVVLACCGVGTLLFGDRKKDETRPANAVGGAPPSDAGQPAPASPEAAVAAPSPPAATSAPSLSSVAPAGAGRPATSTRAAPPPPTRTTNAARCHPSYPTVCLPIVSDLDCGEIPHKRFKALPDDPYRLDGDHDGIACE